jgi:hypothetical protein
MLHLNLCDVLIDVLIDVNVEVNSTCLNHDTVHAHGEPQVYLHPLAGGIGTSAPCLRRVKHRLGMARANGVVGMH